MPKVKTGIIHWLSLGGPTYIIRCPRCFVIYRHPKAKIDQPQCPRGHLSKKIKMETSNGV